VLLVGSSLILFVVPPQQSPVRLGFTSHRSSFGSRGIGNVGWFMPADTLISTSYSANRTLVGFIEATLNVFPYQITPGTVLYLGLYTNGRLAATQDYNLSSSHKTPATILGNVENGVASFSNSLLGFTVSQFPLNATLPVGTTVTVTVWVSNPIWVEVDGTSVTHSYESFGLGSSPPSVIVAEAGNIGPHTLSVGLESNAG